MKINHEELKTLVPHKGKMFLLGEITEADWHNWKIESETKITQDFMFYDKKLGGVPNYACFEIAAQTAASLTGLYCRENGLPQDMGMILSVSDFSFGFDEVADGSVVLAKVEREAEMGNIFSFSVEILIDGKQSGSGKLTVMGSIGSEKTQQN